MPSPKQLLRWLLWKVLGKDHLVLNPDWAPLHRVGDYTLIGPQTTQTAYLPVRYNYHTPKAWDLKYNLRGNHSGQLQFSLSAPGKTPFVRYQQESKLPLPLSVRLENNQVLINNQPHPLVPGSTLPLETPWLLGEFTFSTPDHPTLTRKTGHRIQFQNESEGGNYFEGSVYQDYDQQAGSFPSQILTTLQQHRPLTGRLLDIGCATGLLVTEAHARGLTAHGIDVSDWAIKKANSRHPESCRVLNLDHASLDDFQHRYDFITLHSVIEHLAQPEQALNLIFQLCNPGALVYIQTLNADSLLHRISGKDWCGYTDYTHASPWITADWLQQTSQSAGFKILHQQTSGVWNDNSLDDAWKAFGSLIQIPPAGTVLEDGFGDFVELILQR